MKEFSDLWKFATRNGEIVQLRRELEHVFELIKGCESYLEIGTAEGNSLYVLSHALKENAKIAYIDIGEPHTKENRDEAIANMPNPAKIAFAHTNSHSFIAAHMANTYAPYDVVFIDAGHTYEDVIMDAIVYGGLATKFILFHDVQLPEVKRAFEWYIKQMKFQSVEVFKEDQSPFGYGIIKL